MNKFIVWHWFQWADNIVNGSHKIFILYLQYIHITLTPYSHYSVKLNQFLYRLCAPVKTSILYLFMNLLPWLHSFNMLWFSRPFTSCNFPLNMCILFAQSYNLQKIERKWSYVYENQKSLSRWFVKSSDILIPNWPFVASAKLGLYMQRGFKKTNTANKQTNLYY